MPSSIILYIRFVLHKYIIINTCTLSFSSFFWKSANKSPSAGPAWNTYRHEVQAVWQSSLNLQGTGGIDLCQQPARNALLGCLSHVDCTQCQVQTPQAASLQMTWTPSYALYFIWCISLTSPLQSTTLSTETTGSKYSKQQGAISCFEMSPGMVVTEYRFPSQLCQGSRGLHRPPGGVKGQCPLWGSGSKAKPVVTVQNLH